MRRLALLAVAACGAAAPDTSGPVPAGAIAIQATGGSSHSWPLCYRIKSMDPWWLATEERVTTTLVRSEGTTRTSNGRRAVLRITPLTGKLDHKYHWEDHVDLTYAIEVLRASTWTGEGAPQASSLKPGVKCIVKITAFGEWRETRWDLPRGTTEPERLASERLIRVWTWPIPRRELGPGARWTLSSEQYSLDLRQASSHTSRFFLRSIERDGAVFDLEDSSTGAPAKRDGLDLDPKGVMESGTVSANWQHWLSKAELDRVSQYAVKDASAEVGTLTVAGHVTVTDIPEP